MNPTAEHLDALTEFFNIGMGRAAGALNEMLDLLIRLKVPMVKVVASDTIPASLSATGHKKLFAVQMNFKGQFTGVAALVLPIESASSLVSALTHEAPESSDLNSVSAATLSEVGNILINSVMGSIGNVLHSQLNYSLPSYLEGTIDRLFELDHDRSAVLATAQFTIEDLRIDGFMLLLFDANAIDSLFAAIEKVGVGAREQP